MEITLLLEYTDRSQLREWLMANHATAKECWVTMYRTKIPRTDFFVKDDHLGTVAAPYIPAFVMVK